MSTEGGAAPMLGEPVAKWDGDAQAKEVTNSPAYTFLDELLKQGKLDAQQVAALKLKYQKLHEVVIGAYASETALLNKAKDLNNTFLEKKRLLEEKTNEHTSTEETLKRLRHEVHTSAEELSELEDQRDMKRHEQEELQRRKAEKEYILESKRKQMLAEIAPVVQDLESKLQNLQQESVAHAASKDKEEQACREYMKNISQCTEATQEIERQRTKKRQELSKLTGEPERHRVQVTMLEKTYERFQERSLKLQEEIGGLEKKLEAHQEERKRLDAERLDLGYKLEMLRAAIDKRERNSADIRRGIELETDRGMHLAEQKARLEWERAEMKAGLKRENDIVLAYTKECDKTKRRHEKLRRKNETLAGILPPLIDQDEQCQQQLKELELEHKSQKEALQRFQQDEELFLSQYLAEEKMEEESSALLKGIQSEFEDMEKKITDLAAEEADLRKQIGELEASREIVARAASQATEAARDVKDNLKIKDLILMDLEKQANETLSRLEKCSNLYEIVKNQRNKFANLTQSSAQALSEMKEKTKILANEVDILRGESNARDKALVEEMRVHQHAKNLRDAARVEQNKLHNTIRAKKAEENQQLLQVEKLNGIVNAAEREMIQLRNAYTSSVEGRNLCGIQLIDRNDELCILYEKANIHESITRKGEEAIHSKEELLRFLRLDLAELQRQIELARKGVPSQAAYDTARNTLRNLEKAVQVEEETVAKLTAQLEDPVKSGDGNDIDRARRLGGSDPEVEQLQAKIDILQERLNGKKEQLLEKELILDEVTTLSDKVRMQAAETRESTLELAKRVNDYQAKIRQITRQMMAVVSELSMYQATSMKLEMERAQQEGVLKEGGERLQKGLPPTDDSEHEWYRMERDRIAREHALLARQEDIQGQTGEDDLAAPFARTTAAPRPNMYIPGDELGIPKPYGQSAPFKPTAIGANARHIRKPVVQDIQI